jgi:phosphoribosylamine--glycine ligase
MKVVLVGSGGREHALAYKIAQSRQLKKLFCLPGNPGTAQLGENVDISGNKNVLNFCIDNEIDLVVVGPEQPLVDGLADVLRENNIPVFGPSKLASQIEGDKSFSKTLMKKYNIPTAGFEVFTKSDYESAVTYLKSHNYPVVIKAFGLAAGKGVLICENFEEAQSALDQCFKDNTFGEAGEKVIIEEFMVGQEASIFAVTDGYEYVILPPAQDHKRILDGDKGKNTGGMGAYAPAPLITDKLLKEIEEKIISPTLNAMKSENMIYNGCLYAGLMITEEGPKVVEFNCRFGDPETQSVLPLVEGDFLELLNSAAKGKIDKSTVRYNGGSSVCVVAVSGGYPGKYEKGFEIEGLNSIEDEEILVFHAGTKSENGAIKTSGGRVLGITSLLKENDLRLAKQKAYEGISKISFNKMFYRKDISDKAFKNPIS